MPLEVSGTDALLALVALAAGTVDAIGGGGGLLTLPAPLAAGFHPTIPLERAPWTFPFGFLGALVGARQVLWVRPDDEPLLAAGHRAPPV